MRAILLLPIQQNSVVMAEDNHVKVGAMSLSVDYKLLVIKLFDGRLKLQSVELKSKMLSVIKMQKESTSWER